jgi:hypothetical protein
MTTEETKKDNSDNEPFFTIDGKEYCNHDFCVAEMIRAGVVNVGFSRPYGDYRYDQTKPKDEKGHYPRIEGSFEIWGETIVLHVNCNDLFWWATADCEDLTYDEVGNLYKMWKDEKYKGYGDLIWCCKQRGLMPQQPYRDLMKKDGLDLSVFDGLKDPGPS